MAPHGCYPCRGDDNWVTIAVATDEEWRDFCEAMGNPDWCGEDRFADGFSRRQNQDELDRFVAAWTQNYSSYEIMGLLQKAGVAATPTLNTIDLLRDPHLKERGFFLEDDVPDMEKRLMAGSPWKISGTTDRIRNRAPALGQHNKYVFEELLGLSKGEMAALTQEKVITGEVS
jgi:benzylsuccinate CoA-transferase BbsF subunit